MMTNDDERGEGGKKCPKFDDVICERPLRSCSKLEATLQFSPIKTKLDQFGCGVY